MMLSVFNDSYQAIKIGFKRHPFAAWMIIYSVLLLLFIKAAQQLVAILGIGLGSTLFLIIPTVLYMQEYKQLKSEHRRKQRNFECEKQLSAQQLERMKTLIPSNQLDLFYDVLLPSIKMLHGTLSSIVVEKDKQNMPLTLFDQKFEELCDAFRRLKNIPGLYSTEQSYKMRDIAVTALTFYRVWYRDVLESFYHNHPQKEYLTKDEFILLKRTPTKLAVYLGSEHWRLYEFHDIVLSDIAKLKMNSDIADFIRQAVDEKILTTENKSEAADENHNQKPTTDTQTELKTPIDIQKNEVEAFIQWLQGRIESNDKRYHPNADSLIFSESLLYGDDIVFVSDSLFDAYHATRNVRPERMKSTLLTANISDSKSYKVIKDSEVISLFCIQGVKLKNVASITYEIGEE